MSLDTALAELPRLLTRLLGITAVWRDKWNRAAGATVSAIALMSLNVASTHGTDDTISTYDAGAKTYTDTVTGERRASLFVVVEVYDQRPDSKQALSYLEKLRTRLSLPTTHEALRSFEWVVRRCGDVTEIKVTSGPPSTGQVVSSGLLEVRCAFRATEAELTSYGIIESVGLHVEFGGAVDPDKVAFDLDAEAT